MSLASGLRSALGIIRGIPGDLGLRPYAVSILVTSTTGGNWATGEATTSTVETPFTHEGGQPIKVVQLSQRDVAASGGLYQLQDLRVGPFTPDYTTGGVTPGELDPANEGRLIQWRVVGPGVSGLYKRVGNEFDSSLHYHVILRSLGTQ